MLSHATFFMNLGNYFQVVDLRSVWKPYIIFKRCEVPAPARLNLKEIERAYVNTERLHSFDFMMF